MTPEAVEIREQAKALARDAGFTGPAESPIEWRAALGRFEGEPWFLPYFYEAVMNGDGTPFGTDPDFTECDVLDVTAEEREAFDLPAGCLYAAVTYSHQGFIGLTMFNEPEMGRLLAYYEAQENGE